VSRRRYISTDISHDTKFNKLAQECGDFPALLYILIIPHAGDDGILRGDLEELLLKLVPGRRDKTPQDIEDALKAMERLGLLTWRPDQRAIYLNPATFLQIPDIHPGEESPQRARRRSGPAGSARTAE